MWLWTSISSQVHCQHHLVRVKILIFILNLVYLWIWKVKLDFLDAIDVDTNFLTGPLIELSSKYYSTSLHISQWIVTILLGKAIGLTVIYFENNLLTGSIPLLYGKGSSTIHILFWCIDKRWISQTGEPLLVQ